MIPTQKLVNNLWKECQSEDKFLKLLKKDYGEFLRIDPYYVFHSDILVKDLLRVVKKKSIVIKDPGCTYYGKNGYFIWF